MATKTKQSKSQKIPKLRFAEFESEWEEKKLGEVVGFLKARELKNPTGAVYFSVFLSDENREFLKKHSKIEQPKPKITFSSSDN